MDALRAAIDEAKSVIGMPSFIKLTTVIGWPLPNKAGDESVHGSQIGADEITALKKELDFPDVPFAFDESIVERTRANAAERGEIPRDAWDKKFAAWQFAAWQRDNPERKALLHRVRTDNCPRT